MATRSLCPGLSWVAAMTLRSLHATVNVDDGWYKLRSPRYDPEALANIR
jgi:hypothetical protein